MALIVIVIDNGLGYSEYGVYGAVLVDEKDIDKVSTLIKESSEEYKCLLDEYWENRKKVILQNIQLVNGNYLKDLQKNII